MKAVAASYATGNVSIMDEYAPHIWIGPKAGEMWAASYDKHAKATGVTEGMVKASEPTRTEVKGTAAYVVVPTLYVYKERGTPMQEEGQMTFALRQESGGWKIRAWTWTGVTPHPAK
jgi:ketosteroid isomerase-like protein